MGPLLVGAAGLIWEHVVVADSGPGGGLGASRLLPRGALGLGRIQVEYFSREVNDLFCTPEASACFDRHFLRFCRTNPAVFYSKSADASGL